MATLDSFGIASIDTALTQKFTMTNSVQTGDVVLDEAGLFEHKCAYGEEWMFNVDFSGDLPTDFALASSGPTIVGLTGGVTLIDKVSRSQSSGSANSGSASGEHAPNAAAAA